MSKISYEVFIPVSFGKFIRFEVSVKVSGNTRNDFGRSEKYE